MNDANRTAIVLLAAFWIVVMAIVVFLAWAAPGDVIEALGDVVQELDENNDTAGRLIITLGALALAVFGLLVIVLELAPEDEERELRVKQAGSTTIVPAQALRLRLEEALGSLPEVSTAKARVWTRDNGIATNLDLGLAPGANVANVTQESSRIVVDIIQTELGLPVAGLPNVRISFGDEKPRPVTAAAMRPDYAASSIVRPPEREPETKPQEMLGGAEDAPPAEPSVIDAIEGTADASPGPLVYGDSPEAEGEGAPPAADPAERSPGAEQPVTETAEDPPDSSLRSRLYGGEHEETGSEGGPAGAPRP
jgi:hypothetical protein